MRKLASIQRVKSVEDIYRDGVRADNIVIIKFDDIAWQCVGKRGEFAPGDLCVYVEVSTALPENEYFAFMAKSKYKVKTVKLWGALSQGLPLPLSIFNEDWVVDVPNDFTVGLDVTNCFGIKRVEDLLPVSFGGEQAGLFPTHLLPKTDEDRIQSYPQLLEQIRGEEVFATVKLDGTSCTVLNSPDGGLMVCSRNFAMKDGDNVYWRVIKETPIPSVLAMPEYKHLYFQGEIVGTGIQGNPLALSGQEFYVFNIIDSENGNRPFSQIEIMEFCYEHKIKFAPVFKYWKVFDETVESLLEMLSGVTYQETKNPMEGIVVRPATPTFSVKFGKWFSFKVINNDYLLKRGE